MNLYPSVHIYKISLYVFVTLILPAHVFPMVHGLLNIILEPETPTIPIPSSGPSINALISARWENEILHC
jgi:hypothetical protein